MDGPEPPGPGLIQPQSSGTSRSLPPAAPPFCSAQNPISPVQGPGAVPPQGSLLHTHACPLPLSCRVLHLCSSGPLPPNPVSPHLAGPPPPVTPTPPGPPPPPTRAAAVAVAAPAPCPHGPAPSAQATCQAWSSPFHLGATGLRAFRTPPVGSTVWGLWPGFGGSLGSGGRGVGCRLEAAVLLSAWKLGLSASPSPPPSPPSPPPGARPRTLRQLGVRGGSKVGGGQAHPFPSRQNPLPAH